MEQADIVFHALGHPVRRAVLTRLQTGEARAGVLAIEHDISRPGVSKHLAVLRRAGLIIERKSGRELIYRLNPEAASEARDWLNAFWENRLSALKQLAEARYEREK